MNVGFPLLIAEDTLWDMISKTLSESGSVEKAVFFLLIGFSVISWSLIFWKLFSFYEARRATQKFLAVFDGADSFGEALSHGSGTGNSPVLAVFKAGMSNLERGGAGVPPAAEARQIKINPATTREEVIELSMNHTQQEYFAKLQYGLGFLATAGSATPFIGLFGTVWGILNTFRHIGIADKNSLAGVGAGISSALIATAAGLAVAIPAVIAYNAFLASCDNLQDKTVRFIERVMMLIRNSNALGDSGKAGVANSAAPHARPHPHPAAVAPVGVAPVSSIS